MLFHLLFLDNGKNAWVESVSFKLHEKEKGKEKNGKTHQNHVCGMIVYVVETGGSLQ